jgi:hypothetical protein
MLLNIDRNAKTIKSRKVGYLTGVLYLAPGDLSGYQVCPSASAGCLSACLYTAGRGAMNCTQRARVAKTRKFFSDRIAFVDLLAKDIAKLERKAKREGMRPAVRLNGTSDLPWEKMKGSDGQTLMARFPDVRFYDYTKIAARAWKWVNGKLPANYHLTFSRSEANDSEARALAQAGAIVAVVFSDNLPATWANVPVVNGDDHDMRAHDHGNRGGMVAGLVAKGKAKKDESGFVVPSIPVELAIAA